MKMENKHNKTEKFIDKAIKKHGDKFDYSLVEYINSITKVKILCKEHNIIFEQAPVEHIRGGMSCNLCNKHPKYDTNFFIEKAKITHGNKYDYTITQYKDSGSKIKILCPEHGEFEQLPINHLCRQGCPKCGTINMVNKKTKTKEYFINKAKSIHGDKYDYSLVEYINSHNKVKIICPKHGEFEQIASGHLRGKGCVLCSINETKKKLTATIDEFLTKAKATHGDKYDYSLVEYINSHNKVKIICPKHGEFEQLPYDHISSHGCSKCTSSVSILEKEVDSFLRELNIKTITSSFSIIKPNQLDIYIPSHKLAIEFDGLYWHDEQHIDKNYHIDKTLECEKQGIHLIHIFEDEWLFKQEIVKSRLKNILGLTQEKIYARKCIIKELTFFDSKIFLDSNHLQGSMNSSIRLGLYYNNELVSVMLFNKPRLGIGKSYDGYELSRFCNKLNTSVIGGANKLLKHFIKNYNPKEIISYADRRWSQGGLYDKLGFKLITKNKPNPWYVIGKIRKHRFGFRKSVLVKQGFDKEKSAPQIMLDREIYRIYDCGTLTYNLKI